MSKKRFIIIIIFILAFIISIIISSLYYNNKFSVSFDTGTSDVILTQYLNKNDKVTEPVMPSKDGYIFIEWQRDGKSYNFDSKVKENFELTAKWVKEEYITVKFNTNSDYEIESKKILKGFSIEDLPTSYKKDYEFVGWLFNDKMYINEPIHDDIELVAQYKNNKLNTTYKVGDKVNIIGSYSISAYSLNCNYSMAIGWEREILSIISDSEYPYMVGNATGVTGFFKAESIEKI